MAIQSSAEITQLLLAWSDGDQRAFEQLSPLIQNELRRLAHGYLSGERNEHSLQTTELINEAFLRLIQWDNVDWKNRAHFFGMAATLMRHVLVDIARSRNSARRSGASKRVTFDEAAMLSEDRSTEFIALDDALRDLEKIDPRKSRIVEIRFFGGLSVEETAEVMKLSARTVLREWQFARAWLQKELSNEV